MPTWPNGSCLRPHLPSHGVRSDIMDAIPNHSVVLAPGDSPSKVVQLFDLLFSDGSSYTYVLRSRRYKTVRFVQFPLSQPDEPTVRRQSYVRLRDYNGHVVRDSGITPDTRLVHLDYVNTGATGQLLHRVIQEVLNTQIQMTVINIADYWPDCGGGPCSGLLDTTVSASEITASRCTARLRANLVGSGEDFVQSHLLYTDVMRCNVATILLYLANMGVVAGFQEEYTRLDSVDLPNLDNTIVEITYLA